MVRTYVPASQLIQNIPKRFSGSYSNNLLSYIVRTLNSLLTAEIAGGF